MKQFTHTVSDPLGLHARPAGIVVRMAKKFDCAITLSDGESETDCKKLFMVMALGIKTGTQVTVSFDGTDEDEAFNTMKEYFGTDV